MENKYNLLEEEIIQTVGGCHRLADVFEGRTKTLCGLPDVRLSMFYFLLGLCQFFATPKNTEEWLAMGPEEMGKLVMEGLEKYYDLLWLVGDNPFMQHHECAVDVVSTIKEQDEAKKKKLKKKLLKDNPGGYYFLKSIPTFSSHEFTGSSPLFMAMNAPNYDLSGAELWRYVITFMGQYAIGGKKASKTFPPQTREEADAEREAKKAEKELAEKEHRKRVSIGEKGSSLPGLALGKKGSMHCFVGGGRSLLEDLWLNLLSLEDLENLPQIEGGIGIPYFIEKPVDRQDSVPGKPEELRGREKSLTGLYMPMSRFFLLGENVGDDGVDRKGAVIVCGGIAPADGLYSPFCVLDKGNKENLVPYTPPNGYRSAKEVQAIALIKKDESRCPGFKMCLERLCSSLEAHPVENMAINVLGLNASENSGEIFFSGRDNLFSADVSVPTEGITTNAWFANLLGIFDEFTKWEQKLCGCVAGYCSDLGKEKKERSCIRTLAVDEFWQEIDFLLLEILNSCMSESHKKKVLAKCKGRLFRAYEKACPARGAVAMEALYKHYPLTTRGTGKEFSSPYVSESEKFANGCYRPGLVAKALGLQDKRVRSAIRNPYEDRTESILKEFLVENGVDDDAVNTDFIFEAYRTVLSAALEARIDADGKCHLVEALWGCADDSERGSHRVFSIYAAKDRMHLCEKLRALLKILPGKSERKLSYEGLLCELLNNPWLQGSLARNYYRLQQER